MSLQLHLSRSAGLPRTGLPQRRSFEAWIGAALRVAQHRRAAELSLRLVDLDEARQLNMDYRGRDYATNVLSFPAQMPGAIKQPVLGDLAICAEVVAREAHEQGKRLRDHYAHLCIHGVLHLLDYDHLREAEAAAMEALERRALARLGISDPYLID